MRCITRVAALAGILALLGPLASDRGARVAEAALTPYLERLELISGQAAVDASGNGWGNNKMRVERTSTDDIFATYSSAGSSDTSRDWVLMHRASTGGWSQVTQADGGREPVNLLREPQDMLKMVTWPNDSPMLVSAAGPNGSPPFAATALPGSWYVNPNTYAGAGVNARGDLVVAEQDWNGSNVSNVGIHLVYRTAADGQWHVLPDLMTDVRYLYYLVLPSDTGGLDLVATSGVHWDEVGYTQPSTTTFTYVYDRINVWHTDNLLSQPLQPTQVAYMPQPAGSGAYVDTFAHDAYRDTQGRLHILYYQQGPATNGQLVGHHAIVQNRTILKDVALQNVWCPDGARISQDTAGQLYLLTPCGKSLYIWPADSVDGTLLSSPGTLDVSQYPPSSHLFLAAPRGGTPVADYIDGVYPSGGDAQLVYFRIRLATTTATSPTNTPTTANTPVPTVAPTNDPTPAPTPSGTRPYPATVLSDAPVGYWRLDEAKGRTARDSSGHGKTGTYSATGVTRSVPGALAGDSDKAARFNGTNGTVTVNGADQFAGNAPFSAEAWVNPATLPAGGWSRLLAQEGAGTGWPGWALYLEKSSGQLIGRRSDGSGADYVGGTTTVPLKKWTHVVLTYDGTTLQLYVNGQGPQSATSTRSVPVTNAPLTVASSFGTGNYFNGRVDEPAIYACALSASQVQKHYSIGTGH